MESQPQNPEFRNYHENFHPCIHKVWKPRKAYTNDYFFVFSRSVVLVHSCI